MHRPMLHIFRLEFMKMFQGNGIMGLFAWQDGLPETERLISLENDLLVLGLPA